MVPYLSFDTCNYDFLTMIIQRIRQYVNIWRHCNMHKNRKNRPAHILRFTVLLSVRFRVNTQVCHLKKQKQAVKE